MPTTPPPDDRAAGAAPTAAAGPTAAVIAPPPFPGGPAATAGAPATAALSGPERRRRNVGWRSGDVIRAAALVIALYLVLRLLWFSQVLVFTVFLGSLFGLAVSSGVDRLARFRIPRAVAAAVIVLGSIGLLVGFFAWTAPTLREQSRELRAKLPEAVDKIQNWVDARRGGMLGALLQSGAATADATKQTAKTAATAVKPGDSATARSRAADTARADSAKATGAAPAASEQPTTAAAKPDSGGAAKAGAGGGGLGASVMSGLGGLRSRMFGFITSTVAALGGLGLIIVLSIYVAADPTTYHDGIMHLFPFRSRKRAGEVLSAIATVLRKWLQTQLIAMIVIGAVTTITLFFLGVKAALPLGILAGLFEFIPTVGPILSALPAVAMGFVDSPQKALYVGIAYILIQQLENHILIPMLMKEGVDLPPAVTIVAQALMAMVFGFIGLLVAVPLLAASMVAVKMLYVEDVVGEEMTVLEDEDDDD